MDQPLRPPTERPPIAPSQPAKPKSRGGTVLTLLVVAAVIAGVVWWTKHQSAPEPAGGAQGRPQRGPPMSIVPETAAKGDINITLNALGTVTSLATVTIRSQISGYLIKIDFKEGDEVKKGDLIAEIDSRPYEATLAQAKGAAGARRSAAEGRAGRSDALPGAGGAERGAAPDAGHPGRAGRPGPGHGRSRPRRGPVGRGEPELLPDPVADRRSRRTAPGRPGQLCHAGRRQRHCRDHADRSRSACCSRCPRTICSRSRSVCRPAPCCPRPRSTAAAPPRSPTARLQTFDSQIDPTTGTIKLRAQFPNEPQTRSFQTSSSTSACCSTPTRT